MHRFALRVVTSLVFAVLTVPASVQAGDDVPAPVNKQTDANSVRTPLTSFDIAFVDADLKEPGLATTGPDSDWVDWKVPDLGRLVQERAPKVLAANGLAGMGTLVPAPAPGAALDMASVAPGRPVLVLQVTAITKYKATLFSKGGTVRLDAQMLDRASGASGASGATAPVWRTGLGGGLGFDPVLGVLKINRVDADWVDRILVLALDQLAKNGLVQLPNPKAISPRD